MVPKITAILPSYNVVNYIEQCVESVLDQTLGDIEILCIDAGSTDGTWEILERIASGISKIKLYKSAVKSYGYQMNLGIREARGEYIAIIETDDYIDSDMFELLYNEAKKTNADVSKAVHYELYEYGDGSYKEIPLDYIPEEYISGNVFSPDEHPEVHNWDANIWNAIYRRDFLLDSEIFFQETPGAAFQDIAFQQMVLNEARTVVYTRNHIYHYRRVRPGASTWSPNCVRFVYSAYRDLLADYRIKEGHRKNIYLRMVRAFFTEYRKALCGGKSDDDCSEAADWFAGRLKTALDSGLFELDDIWADERNEIMYFLISRKMYTKRLLAQAEAVYKWLEGLKGLIRDKKIIIFGAGRYGMLLLPFLIKNGINIEAMADNQIWLTNNSFYGIRVYNADEAARHYRKAFFLIANKTSGEQIKAQLSSLGIPDDNMLIFDGADRKLVEGIRRLPLLPEKKYS